MSQADLSSTGPDFANTPSREPAQSARWQVARFADITAVPCPCGQSRRALADAEAFPGTVHQVDISTDARLHYHKRLTETYYILDCQPGAQMQLDDEFIDISPGTCILIPPGVRHRAIGEMRVLNIVLPKFDPEDEWFD